MDLKLALAPVASVSLVIPPVLCAPGTNAELSPALRPRRLEKSECVHEIIPDSDGVPMHWVDLRLRFVDGWAQACHNLGLALVLFHCSEATGKDARMTGKLKDPDGDGCKIRLQVGHVSCVEEGMKCMEGILSGCVGSPLLFAGRPGYVAVRVLFGGQRLTLDQPEGELDDDTSLWYLVE